MADLFDMSVAGYGFHITGHLLALIALIIACLAITGHISYSRDKDANFEQVTLDGVTYGDEGGANTGRLRMKYIAGFLQPRGAGAYFVTKQLQATPPATPALALASSAERLILPARSWIHEARIVCVAADAVNGGNINVGFRPVATTAIAAGADNTVFAAANFGGAPAVGQELVVVDESRDEQNNKQIGGTGRAINVAGAQENNAVDQQVIANVATTQSTAAYRIELWYHQREFATAF